MMGKNEGRNWFWLAVVWIGLAGLLMWVLTGSPAFLLPALSIAAGAASVWFVAPGVKVTIRAMRRPAPVPEARWWLSYPKIAALEHDTGIYDLYTKLGAEGHDEVVLDACATCAEERAATAAGDHTHDRLYKSQNQIVCGVCWAKVAHIDSCWHPAQKWAMTVRGPVCGLCDRSLSGSLKPSMQYLSPGEFLVEGGQSMESWTWDEDGSALSAYEAGLISPDQIRDLGLTYERAVVVPTRTPNLVCRHVWQKQKGSEACDRFGTRYMQYGCVKCTATRACYEGASPYDQ